MLIICRLVAGTFGSSPLANAGGTLADIWMPHQRGKAMSIFAAAPFLGPVLGPVIGGFLSEYGKSLGEWITHDSELEMDLLGGVDLRLGRPGRHYFLSPRNIHQGVTRTEGTLPTKKHWQQGSLCGKRKEQANNVRTLQSQSVETVANVHGTNRPSLLDLRCISLRNSISIIRCVSNHL